MNKVGKCSALLLIVLFVVSSLIIANSSCAQIPKPTVPEFTLSFVDNSYNMPTTSSTDPYTGQVVTHQGYHVQKMDLVVAIKNQPLVYQYTGSFYYNINVKGHYGQWDEWSQWFKADELPLANSSSPQTLITLGRLAENGLIMNSGSREIDIPWGSQVDFQVAAMIGGAAKNFTQGYLGSLYFAGETSGWSNTQTITIDETAPTSTPNTWPSSSTPNPTSAPTATPQQPSNPTGTAFRLSWEQTAIVVLIVLVASLLVVVGLLWRKINVKKA